MAAVFPGGAKWIHSSAASNKPHIFARTAASDLVDSIWEVYNGSTVGTRRFHIRANSAGTSAIALPFRDWRVGATAALGGGAGATLGSTPATTAQNEWLRIRDPLGAIRWVPAWN